MRILLLFIFFSLMLSCTPRLVGLPASYVKQNQEFFTRVSDSVYVGRKYVYFKQKKGFYPSKISSSEAFITLK